MDQASPYLMPVAVGIQLAHATVQAIADAEGVDLLHIKGPAIDPVLIPRYPAEVGSDSALVPRRSMDADVWVRPSQSSRFLATLVRHRWTVELSFQDDSTFEHAAMLTHPFLAPVDVHRRFPGVRVDPEKAFDLLWAERDTIDIAHVSCPVPSITAQRVVLLINAARGKLAGNDDVVMSWNRATELERASVDALAEQLGAQVALAASTGRLDDYRGWREHALWAQLAAGDGSPAALWWARIRAQKTLGGAIRMGFKQVFPSPRRVRAVAGVDLTRLEVARAYAQRMSLGARELRRQFRERLLRTKAG